MTLTQRQSLFYSGEMKLNKQKLGGAPMYTINELAKLAKISTRTLRYYDQIGLLKAKRQKNTDYRYYDERAVDELQQILFFKSFGFTLTKIKDAMNLPQEKRLNLLEEQYHLLLTQQTQLTKMIQALSQTLVYYKGGNYMNDSEKFAAFKAEKIATNETQYGQEIREKYGNEIVNAANDKWSHLTVEQYEQLQKAESDLFANLKILSQSETINLDSTIAQNVFNAHKTWLQIAAPFYNQNYHRSLADMYVEDQRFAAYYNDRVASDIIGFMRDIIYHYTNDFLF